MFSGAKVKKNNTDIVPVRNSAEGGLFIGPQTFRNVQDTHTFAN
jgi:hypothetical protein